MTAYRCPVCRGPLGAVTPESFLCERDRLTFPRVDGIWRFLPPGRAAHYAQFVREYEAVRQAEGRGSADPAYYRALPFEDLSGRMAGMWRMRAASYRALAGQMGAGGRALDLGAGNGWLSYRLSLAGHTVTAVDLLVNEWDGLGAHRFYDTPFTPVQAEFDALPFAAGQFDWIVFNASLHYSTDFVQTLAAVLPLLAPSGRVAIVDTPVYHDASSGAQMVAEREAEFAARYGFPSNSLPLENYMTFDRLCTLAQNLNLKPQLFHPRFGIRFRLGPLLARLRGRREPARFPVVVLARKGG